VFVRFMLPPKGFPSGRILYRIFCTDFVRVRPENTVRARFVAKIFSTASGDARDYTGQYHPR
jgi:hypothetical protein